MSDSRKQATPALGPEELATTVRRPQTPPLPDAGDAPTWPSAPRDAPAAALAPGRILADRYTVLDFLGQGGMGLVLAAYDARLDRRVALKLLRHRGVGSSSGGEERARLVREAQSMARLSHPNVVAVYDSGTLEDGSLFIAMEYVEGQTLRQWCAQQPRSWRQVLGTYLEAGRGLAAAHAAGLIHRDFKPDNVLVGRDGRARVTDFGLARVRSAGAVPSPASKEQPEEASRQGVASPQGGLTVAGSLMGTPRYMAPELLLRGHPADIQTDVFSFCAALYEALYGQLPFPADTWEELIGAHAAGKLAPPPASSEVPAWVARTVLRGLHGAPSQRPASMEEVLAELEDDPQARRRSRLLAVGLASAVVLLGGLVAASWMNLRSQAPGCERMERRLTDIWDEPMKARVSQSLLATGVPYAPDTARRVATLLDGYASTWVRMRTEVCEAAGQERAEQPRSLEALQEGCLERRRSRLRALTELLASDPDAGLVDQAVQAVQALPALEYCADAQALTATVPPPEEPAVRARVEALQEEADRLEALYEAGKYPEGLERGEALLKQAESVPYAPLHARILYVMSELREPGGDYEGAKALARRAIVAAAKGKDAQLVAKAWSQLLFVLASRQSRGQEALDLALALEAAVELADDALVRADADNTLGNALLTLERYEEARQRHSRALAVREKVLGLEHPHTTLSLGNLGRALLGLGRYEEARESFERAVTLREQVLGPAHPANAFPLTYLGHGQWVLGRYEEARKSFERAVVVREKGVGPEDPMLHSPLTGLGHALSSLGHHDEARKSFERSLALRERALGPDNVQLAPILNGLGTALRQLGRSEEARQRHERALALQEKALGPTHSRVASSLLGLAELHLTLGKPAEALPLLERALPLASVEDRASVQLALAMALWDARRELTRARELALQAREFWRGIGHEPNLARASRWLAEHPGP
ncbi:serine/threonine-protein kinase [Hyalangium gracile]|uniref:serine/threonine-protein kinase n=1 Tax=Hyalangium gracile TaxID=394092 RepID=UPI00295E405C|nr:serine/threonine-protein kinase [Hyalangium gracile]